MQRFSNGNPKCAATFVEAVITDGVQYTRKLYWHDGRGAVDCQSMLAGGPPASVPGHRRGARGHRRRRGGNVTGRLTMYASELSGRTHRPRGWPLTRHRVTPDSSTYNPFGLAYGRYAELTARQPPGRTAETGKARSRHQNRREPQRPAAQCRRERTGRHDESHRNRKTVPTGRSRWIRFGVKFGVTLSP